MSRTCRAAALLALLALLTQSPPPGTAQPSRPSVRPPSAPTAFVPRFEAVAETRLLMEGLAQLNYRSLNRLLKTRPTDGETWTFARGQAILLAETGNLLLLRPPRNSGRETWMRLAMDLRDKATIVAKATSARDHARSKAALTGLTASCNRCHQTFRVPVKVAPDPEPAERSAE